MTKTIKTIIIFAVIFISVNINAADMKAVIAAPVPFNPHTHILSVMHLPNYDSFTLEVFDVAGDRVVTKSYNISANVKWNGRNNFGKIVKPGMYILKVTARETSTDKYGMKKIRILVKY